MITDCGRPPGQSPVKPVLVHLRVSLPTSPDTLATPVHLPVRSSGRWYDMSPENDVAAAYPLIAPTHSAGSLCQLPSTHVPPWATTTEMVRVAKPEDSNVPVQLPATFTTGPAGAGDAGLDDDLLLPHLHSSNATRSQAACAATRALIRQGDDGWFPAH
jgi:hypothetical protein